MTDSAREVTPAIFEHIEHYLGPVNAGFTENAIGEPSSFQVVRCTGRVKDTTFYCTLGLGSHPLCPSPSASPVRHELLIALPRYFGTLNIPSLLQQLGSIAIDRGKPYAEGELMLGKNPVFDQWPFRGFFVTHPCVIEDEAFAICTREDGRQVHFLWMVPLYRSEIDFARAHGPSRLEDLFIEKHVDLVNLSRKPAVD